MRTEIEGVLEIDHESGVIYFHNKNERTILRISGLPPVPELNQIASKMLDIRVGRETNVNYALIHPELEEETECNNSVG